LDSLLPDIDGILNQNESEFSEVLCADNCPFYVLPNIFTPNNDGQNDLFQPFPFKFGESIDLKVFNRWGDVVFETKDPAILWDGKDNESGNVVSDGVYYYTITINTIRLSGIEPEETSGYIQVLGGSNQSTN
jgi:gliding motility-associated-like protein